MSSASPAIFRAALAAAALAACAPAAAAGAGAAEASAAQCVMPEIVRASLATAEERLRAAGCSVGEVTRVGSRTVPEGDVVSFPVAVGVHLPAGTAIALAVSAGPACTVPKIGSATTLSKIGKRLAAANCKVGKVRYTPSSKRRGTVLRLNPVAGHTIPPKGAVQVYLSSGHS